MITDLYAVVGNPISHSKSPGIHAMFARQTAQDMEYTAIQAPLDGFEEVVTTFFARGGSGLNVTVPFKERAWRLASWKTPEADRAGAVNTLFMGVEGRLHGANTDGAGLVADLCGNLGCSLQGRRVVVLGAGGAVRGVMQAVLEQKPRQVILANRTIDKAHTLAATFADCGSVMVKPFADLDGDVDIVINGTSASLSGSIPVIPEASVRNAELVYDMMYAERATPFLAWAAQAGARRCADGLGMLVEQAAEAFFIWRGVRPQSAPVLRALRSHGM